MRAEIPLFEILSYSYPATIFVKLLFTKFCGRIMEYDSTTNADNIIVYSPPYCDLA